MSIIDVKPIRDQQSSSQKLERSRFETELGVSNAGTPFYVGMTISALLLYLESVSGAWAEAPREPKPNNKVPEAENATNNFDLRAELKDFQDQPVADDQPLETHQRSPGGTIARSANSFYDGSGSSPLTDLKTNAFGPTHGPVAFSVFPTNDNPLPEISTPAPRGAASQSNAISGLSSADAGEAEDQDDDTKAKPNQRPVTSGPLQLQTQFMNTAVLIALTDLVRNAQDADGDVLDVRNISVSSGELKLTGEGFTFIPATPGEVVLTYLVTDGKQGVQQTAVFQVDVFERAEGTSGADTLEGTAHRDSIEGGSGDDIIDAGADMDDILGGAGNDIISGGAGDDIIAGGDGDDLIYGGAGNDIISGGAGNDRIYGEDGDDILFGNEGDDTIALGAGADRADGGGGDDTFTIGNDQAVDFIDGGDGTSDNINLSTSSTSVTLDMRDGSVTYNENPSLTDPGSTAASSSTSPLEADLFVNIEKFDLTNQNDTIVASADPIIEDNTIVEAPSLEAVPAEPAAEQPALSVLEQALEIIRNASTSIEEFEQTKAAEIPMVVQSFNGNAGIDTIDYTASTEDLTFELAEGIVYGQDIGIDLVEDIEIFIGGAGDDVFAATQAPVETLSAVVHGTDEHVAGEQQLAFETPTIDPVEVDVIVSTEAPSDNTFIGGAGEDTLSYEDATESVTINLAEAIAVGEAIGSDSFAEIETFVGGAAADTFRANETLAVEEVPIDHAFIGGDGQDTLSYEHATETVTINLAEAIAEGEAIGSDSFAEIETFVGGAAADTFLANETLALEEVPIDHTFIGGEGEDTLSYVDATEAVTINLAEAIAVGEEIGSDSFAEIETFVGGSAADTFLATEGPVAQDEPVNHSFVGGDGQDTLSYEDATEAVTINLAEAIAVGEAIGSDSFAEIENFVGGAAADTFLATEGPVAQDTPLNHSFDGGDGQDTLSYEDATEAVTINLAEAIAEGEEIGSDSFDEIENFVGGAAADTFLATEGPVAQDTPADHTFIGGAGQDTLSYEDATESVTINLAEAIAQGEEIGSDSFDEIENFVGGAAADTFLATEGPVAQDTPADHTFIGGAGQDTLSYADATESVTINLAEAIAEGEAIGSDSFEEVETFVGGSAADTFLATETVAAGEAPVDNTLIGGAGEDTLSYEGTNEQVVLDVTQGTATGTEIGTDTFAGIENFILGSGDDIIHVSSMSEGGDRQFSGGEGGDTLSYEGTSSQVLIDMLTGTVSCDGAPSDNFNSFEAVIGGDADDTIIFGVGVVSLDGGGGSDTFIFMTEDAAIGTGSNSGSGSSTPEIRNFEVGDVVRLDRFDIFSRALDHIENAFEDFVDRQLVAGDEGVYGDDIPIRIRTELAEEMWRTFIDADFDRDEVYEFSISIDGYHDLIITQNNNSNSGSGHA
jgi:Ca2+-binding RTX toxin-like protein